MDGGHSHAFDFTLALSFVINCESQSEVNDYWAKLSAGGEPGQCGWLTDKYGISWQVVPKALSEMLLSGSPTQTEALMGEIGKMTRLDLAALEAAFNR